MSYYVLIYNMLTLIQAETLNLPYHELKNLYLVLYNKNSTYL